MSQPFSRRVTMFEWLALGALIALWHASAVLPEGIAVVPEYIALHNALLTTALVAFTILVRHAWRRLRQCGASPFMHEAESRFGEL